MKLAGILLMVVSGLLLSSMFLTVAFPMVMSLNSYPAPAPTPDELADSISLSLVLTMGALVLGPLGVILYVVGFVFSGRDSSSNK